MTSFGKENRSSQCLSYKEQQGRGEEEKKEGCVGGGLHSHKQSEGLGGALWVYKIGLKRPVIAMAITRKPQSLSLSERDRELELEL